LSTKESIISIRTGEFEEVKMKLTSGIHGQHSKGGSSSNRFRNIRDQDIETYFKKIMRNANTFEVSRWKYIGDKEMVKKYETMMTKG